MTSFKTRILRARDSFWFLPALLGVAALIVAQTLVMLDRYLDGTALGSWGFLLYRVGASGSRDILGAIGGSMLAVAATSFGARSGPPSNARGSCDGEFDVRAPVGS